MFGYIRLQEDQLRLCDLKTYKHLYCSLCRQIGRYSQLARFFLSFDMLFSPSFPVTARQKRLPPLLTGIAFFKRICRAPGWTIGPV